MDSSHSHIDISIIVEFLVVDYPLVVAQTVISLSPPCFSWSKTPYPYLEQWSHYPHRVSHTRLPHTSASDSDLGTLTVFSILDYPFSVPQTVILLPSPCFSWSKTHSTYPTQWSYPLQSLFHTRLTLPRTPDSDPTPLHSDHVPQTLILPP